MNIFRTIRRDRPRRPRSLSAVHAPVALALEPRFMFDAAGAATGVDAAREAAAEQAAEAAVARAAADDDAAAREVAFIDSAVADAEALAAGLRDGIEVVVVDSRRDGLSQMAEALAGRTGLDAVHILSHGGAGHALIGDMRLDAGALTTRAADLRAIGDALAPGGDLLLYGCRVAEGGAGAAFLSGLAAATGADVAASDDVTGAARLGGDWDLEASTGMIEAAGALTAATQESYAHALEIFDFSAGTTVAGVTVTATTNAGNTLGISNGMLHDSSNTANYVDVSFSQIVDVSSLRFAFWSNSGGFVNFHVSGHRGLTTNFYSYSPTYAEADYTNNSGNMATVDLSGGDDWGAVSFIRIKVNNSSTVGFQIDDINFTVPTLPPELLTVTASDTLLTEADAGDTVTLSATFSEPMNTGVTPTISFPAENPGAALAFQSGSWTNNNTTYVATYNVSDTNLDLSNIDVRVSGGQDSGGANVTAAQTRTDVFSIDTVAPTVPSVALDAGSDSGTAGDRNTNDATPTLSGTTSANATVTIRSSVAGVIGTATANGAGAWSFTPGTALAQGSHTITATATDANGNTSAASAGLAVTIDTTAPAAPAAPDLAAASDSGASTTDNVTSDTTPTLTGTAEAGATVTVRSSIAGVLGTATADGAGAWSFTPGTALAAGSHTITATATDAAGNTSAASAGLAITIDTTAPAAPAAADLAAASDSGASDTDNITSDTTPTLAGTAEAGATVTISSSIAGVLGTATADGAGAWSFTPGTALAQGSHTITATATDAAGNASSASAGLAITIDTTAPAAPAAPDLAAASDSGTSDSDNLTSDTTPTLTGTATPGTTITLTSSVGGQLGTTAADGAGRWTFTPGTALAAGDHTITVTATDAAGNTSGTSAQLVVTVDTTAPAAPSAPDLAAASDTGASDSDNLTDEATPTLTGTAEAGATVTLSSTLAGVLGTTTADGTGAWSFTPGTPLADGAHTITATATDAAGNISGTSAGLLLVVDAAPPAAPTQPALAASSDTGASSTDALTRDATPALSGTAEAGAVVTIRSDLAGVLGTTTADGAGRWSFTPAAPLADGVHAMTVTARDATGNVSAPSTPLVVTVDTAASTMTTSAPAGALSPGAETAVFRVRFDGPVETLTPDDFTLVTTGTAEGSVASVAGRGADWAVTVTGISGLGALRLDLKPGSAVVDAAGNSSPAARGTSVLTVEPAPETPAGGPGRPATERGPGPGLPLPPPFYGQPTYPLAGLDGGLALPGATLRAGVLGSASPLEVGTAPLAAAWRAMPGGGSGDGGGFGVEQDMEWLLGLSAFGMGAGTNGGTERDTSGDARPDPARNVPFTRQIAQQHENAAIEAAVLAEALRTHSPPSDPAG